MTDTQDASLFSPITLGSLRLRNRMVMASMTRARSAEPGLLPGPSQVRYYRQRASAGLIMSEGLWPSRAAIGFPHVPGLFDDAQVAGWRQVTDAVHEAGGAIFAQLGHAGSASHPSLHGGTPPAGPSAIDPQLSVFGTEGFAPTVTPRAMTLSEIAQTIADYGTASRRALAAGFDGVELHAAGPYLLPQFLSPVLNVRTDRYGGTINNRIRIVLEALEEMIAAFGADRVGIKISPATSIGPLLPNDDTLETYRELASALDPFPLSHVQIVRPPLSQAISLAALADPINDIGARLRAPVIANGGYVLDTASKAIASGAAALVSFGAPFIANPDLIWRLANDAPLTTPDRDRFYGGGDAGYVDYPPVQLNEHAG